MAEMMATARWCFIGHTTCFVTRPGTWPWRDMNVNVTMAATVTFTATVVLGVFSDLHKRGSWTMVTKDKKPRARWQSDTERKLINVSIDILGEYSGIMMTRMKKEATATTCLNVYISEELNRPENTSRRKFATNWTSIWRKESQCMWSTNEKRNVQSTHNMMSNEVPWWQFLHSPGWRQCRISGKR